MDISLTNIFKIPDDDRRDALFVDGSALKALNKCRNPGHDPKGPYCYSISLENSLTASKQYCPIRSCRSSGKLHDIVIQII